MIHDSLVKHYSLYQYLQRVLRPLWNVSLAYKTSNEKDQYYKPTFGSLSVPKQKLSDLLNFIEVNESSLYGEVYEDAYRQDETFVRNQALLNIVSPVFLLKNNDKAKLELLEKNSLKNLKLFITRCI